MSLSNDVDLRYLLRRRCAVELYHTTVCRTTVRFQYLECFVSEEINGTNGFCRISSTVGSTARLYEWRLTEPQMQRISYRVHGVGGNYDEK